MQVGGPLEGVGVSAIEVEEVGVVGEDEAAASALEEEVEDEAPIPISHGPAASGVEVVNAPSPLEMRVALWCFIRASTWK